MTELAQRNKKYESVRMRPETKERLEKVMHEKSLKEKRRVTELELASAAIEAYCAKEEKKLGI
jgi:predicted DNA-binding protein